MMSVLRKSCRNCTRSKRKCAIQIPKCARCTDRGLECIYDVEHLNAPHDPPKQLAESQLGLHQHGHCLLRAVAAGGGVADLSKKTHGHDHTLELIRLGYRTVPTHIQARQPSIFVHPCLLLQRDSYDHLAIFEVEGESNALYNNFQHLIQLNLRTKRIGEILAALQALLIHVGTFILSPSLDEQKMAKDSFPILSDWTQLLLDSAQHMEVCHESPWQRWIFGESVRRTILMSYTLVMAHSVLRTGECSNWLFLESLPFDRRSGLWMAQSPQAWIASAGVSNGAEVGEVLSSFHEFAEDQKRSARGFCGDMFLLLLVMSHNGPERFGSIL